MGGRDFKSLLLVVKGWGDGQAGRWAGGWVTQAGRWAADGQLGGQMGGSVGRWAKLGGVDLFCQRGCIGFDPS